MNTRFRIEEAAASRVPSAYGRAGDRDPRPPDLADGGEIDVRALLLTLWRGKWIIAACVAAALALAGVALARATPLYTATAEMLFGADELNIIDLEEVVVRNRDTSSGMSDQIETLRSPALLGRVVDALGLAEPSGPAAESEPAPSEIMNAAPAIAAEVGERLRAALEQVGVLTPPPPAADDPEARERRARLAAIDRLRRGLGLRQVGESRIVAISYTATDPELAARIPNALGEHYLREQLESRLDAAGGASEWLRERVAELEVDVREAEEAVETARAALSLDAAQGPDLTQEQLRAVNAKLGDLRAERIALEARNARIRRTLADDSAFAEISDFRESDIIKSLRNQLLALRTEAAQLRLDLSGEHRGVARIDNRIDFLEAQLREEAETIAAALENELLAVRDQEVALASELGALEATKLSLARSELRLRQLEREAQASRTLYTTFLGRMKEAAEQQALQTPDARILSAAEPPRAPDSDKARRTVMLAGLSGLIAGAGFVFLRERMNEGYRSVGELERRTGARVLGALPRMRSRFRRRNVVDEARERPDGSLAEAARNLRTSLLQSGVGAGAPPRTVMFTSSVPREGKSGAAMLFALSCRRMGKTTIVVDCDLRRPTIRRLSGAARPRADLVDILRGAATLDEAVTVLGGEELHLLSASPMQGRRSDVSPADALTSGAFARLVDALRARYDVVVIDTPPTLAAPDARIVAQVADAIVYVVRWNHTPRGAVAEGVRELTSLDLPIAGLVLSMVDEAKAAKLASAGHGSYRARYSSHYT